MYVNATVNAKLKYEYTIRLAIDDSQMKLIIKIIENAKRKETARQTVKLQFVTYLK